MFCRETVAALRYQDEFLDPIVRSFAGAICPDFILLQDEACSDRCVRVWRHQGERPAECKIVQYDRFCGGSTMVRGGICMFRKETVAVLTY